MNDDSRAAKWSGVFLLVVAVFMIATEVARVSGHGNYVMTATTVILFWVAGMIGSVALLRQTNPGGERGPAWTFMLFCIAFMFWVPMGLMGLQELHDQRKRLAHARVRHKHAQ